MINNDCYAARTSVNPRASWWNFRGHPSAREKARLYPDIQTQVVAVVQCRFASDLNDTKQIHSGQAIVQSEHGVRYFVLCKFMTSVKHSHLCRLELTRNDRCAACLVIRSDPGFQFYDAFIAPWDVINSIFAVVHL